MSNDPTQPPVPPPPPDPTAPMPAQPPGQPPTGGTSTRRTWLIVLAVIAVLLVGGAVLAFALSDDDEPATSGPTGETSVTGPTSPPETTGPTTTGSTGTSGVTGLDTGNAGCAGATAPETLADGTYFGFLESIDVEGVAQFDLACFYTGEEANQQAAARGDEVPVPNDVYIVNDNPVTRDMPVDPSAELLLIDWNACCETTPGATLEAFASSLGHKQFVEIDGWRYAGSLSPYWVTIANGQIVGIEEQFLP